MKKKLGTALLLLFLAGLTGYVATYKVLFADNVRETYAGEPVDFRIPTGSTYQEVLQRLHRQQVLRNPKAFELVALRLDYPERVKPGRYLLNPNMGNLALIRKLRSGAQDPVRITFNNIQNKQQLAKQISAKLEATKPELLQVFNDQQLLDSLGLTEESFPTIFLANTYEFYWNTNARQFVERMLKEYRKFWDEDRQEKARSLGLTPTEAIILASIVQKESNQYDEYERIAGVYVNRLQKGWPLQTDPTVVYALKKAGIARRVYSRDLKVDSPYNTYLHTGLPPGPICLPELKSIDKTLDAEAHNYMYFCAKEDFSGYHAFAETWEEHKANAARYQRALNQRNIR